MLVSSRILRNACFCRLASSAATSGIPDEWPRSKVNTLINVCPEGTQIIVERFGRYLRTESPGLFAAIPVIDKLAYMIDMREKTCEIDPQDAITKDNVSVQISGVLYFRFVDSKLAAYGAANPIFAVVQFAQSAMRSALGEMELDECFHNRNGLNRVVRNSIIESAKAWGVDVLRYEVTDIRPDELVSRALDKQAVAERARREKILDAEGDRKASILRSEGELAAARNAAEATHVQIVRKAQAEAEQTRISAEAQAKALNAVAKNIVESGGDKAAAYALSQEYMRTMSLVGSRSNTMFFCEGTMADSASKQIAQVAQLVTGGTKAFDNAKNPKAL
ncbi:MAG: hypothetical protein MHM6MM_001486 [Cercozoa sp. M6MM]